jgi:hypothetical protein
VEKCELIRTGAEGRRIFPQLLAPLKKFRRRARLRCSWGQIKFDAERQARAPSQNWISTFMAYGNAARSWEEF